MSAYETQAALAASAQQAQQPFTHLRVLFLGAESQSTNHHFLASWPHAQFVRSGYHTQPRRARLFISAEKSLNSSLLRYGDLELLSSTLL